MTVTFTFISFLCSLSEIKGIEEKPCSGLGRRNAVLTVGRSIDYQTATSGGD